MFGLFGPEKVICLEIHGGVLSCLSKKKRSPGSSAKVRFIIPSVPKALQVDVPLAIIHVRKCSEGFVTVGQVQFSDAKYQELEELLKHVPPDPHLAALARSTPRLPTRLKVVCRELPGFSAVTVDIGGHGVLLSTHGPVNPGTDVRMNIELDAGSVGPHLSAAARCIWCAPDPKGAGKSPHLAGFVFTTVEANLLNNYLRSLAYRLNGDIQHRTISDGEMYIRDDDNVSRR